MGRSWICGDCDQPRYAGYEGGAQLATTSTRALCAPLHRVTGSALSTASAGHAGATVSTKLTSNPDDLMKAGQDSTKKHQVSKMLACWRISV